jgi:DNA-binding MarR family transcriptional regulator
MRNMTLRSQDVLVALKLAVSGGFGSYAELAAQLGISSSQVHAAMKRAAAAGLVDLEGRVARRAALLEFLVHGARYAFATRRGPVVRGLPTAHSAAPLKGLLSGGGDELVWPDPEGTVRGESLEPLHPAAPFAARNDPRLYEALALLDAIRAGCAREPNLAEQQLEELLADAS